MTRPLTLRIDADDAHRATWVAEVIVEVAGECGWTVDTTDDGSGASTRPDAVAVIVPIGASIDPIDEPTVAVWVEAGTPRSPVAEESPPHLPARLELTVGAFRARRNQQVTRDALLRFFERVERTRVVPTIDQAALAAPLDPAEAVARADAPGIVAENQALLDRVDASLARTTMTPEAAQAVGADRAILAAAIDAPVLDLVIIERAATRLAAVLDRNS